MGLEINQAVQSTEFLGSWRMLVVAMETFQFLCGRGCNLRTLQMQFVAVPESNRRQQVF